MVGHRKAGAVYSISGKVKDRKALGMTIALPMRRSKKVSSTKRRVYHRVDRLVEQPTNGDRIEASPFGAPAFVFLPGREPQRLAEILLMAAHNPAVLIDFPVKSLYG
jgi:hypothetical protein